MRKRIHPGVAISAIICLTVIVISAEFHAKDPLISLKLLVIAIIAGLAGIKLRRWLT